MYKGQDAIVPYASYIALIFVGLLIFLKVSVKLAARETRLVTNADLSIYARPSLNQRKTHTSKKQESDKHAPPETMPTVPQIIVSK